MEVRSGNMKIRNFIPEIELNIQLLKEVPTNKRVIRQLIDAYDLLNMLKSPPYCRAETVSELKNLISAKRAEIKDLLEKVDPFTVGHQFRFDELDIKPVSKELLDELEKEKEDWQKELRWLHKCLGMCTNRDYFK